MTTCRRREVQRRHNDGDAVAALRHCLSRLHPWPLAAPEYPGAPLPSLPPVSLQQPITDLLVQQSLRAPLGDGVTLKGSCAWTHPVLLSDWRQEHPDGRSRHSGPVWSSERNVRSLDGFRARSMRWTSIHQICAESYKIPCARTTPRGASPDTPCPMRGDLLQRAGGGQSGCFEPLDDLFDLGQPGLEGTNLVPNAVQVLRKDFGLGAPGRHRAEPISSLASGDLRLRRPAKARSLLKRVIRSFVPSGLDSSPARRAQCDGVRL
jgi:hypothetical protein